MINNFFFLRKLLLFWTKKKKTTLFSNLLPLQIKNSPSYLNNKKKVFTYNMSFKISNKWKKYFKNWATLDLTSNKTVFKNTKHCKLSFFKIGLETELLVNLNKYYYKWINLITLVKSIFFFDLKFKLFTNKFLKKETLFLNWETLNQNFQIFKKTQPHYLYKNYNYGGKVINVFKQEISKNVNGVFITDLVEQKKILYYARISGFFTVVLTPSIYNPWLYSYPVLQFSNSFSIQKLFLQHLFLIKKEVLQEQLLDWKWVWKL